MSYYVYKITNLINGKIYIGKTNNIHKRWNKHKAAALRQNPNDFSYLHKAMLKYGFHNFIIEELYAFDIEKEALSQEIVSIEKLQSKNKDIGYNLTDGGEGVSGFKHSDESKQKMSESKKIIFLGENNPFYGKSHSKESKLLISQAASQRIGEKNHFFGKKHSQQSIDLMRQNQKGKGKKKYFTTQDIEEIKYKKQILKISYKAMSLEYDVHWKTIANAANGKKSYSK